VVALAEASEADDAVLDELAAALLDDSVLAAALLAAAVIVSEVDPAAVLVGGEFELPVLAGEAAVEVAAAAELLVIFMTSPALLQRLNAGAI
jgi:hypothetical protein